MLKFAPRLGDTNSSQLLWNKLPEEVSRRSVVRTFLTPLLMLYMLLPMLAAGQLAAQTPAFVVSNAPLEVVEGNHEVEGVVSLTDTSPVPRAMRITGGSDADRFRLGAAVATVGGAHLARARRIIFNEPPDFELPLDRRSLTPLNKANNNIYVLEVTADFDGLRSISHVVTVQVTDVAEPPVFASQTQVDVVERSTSVVELIVTSVKGVPLVPSIEVQFNIGAEDGDSNTIFDADNALFQITAMNLLAFISPPSADLPRGFAITATNRNLYRVRVSATHAGSASAFSITSDIEITVQDTDSPPQLDTSISPISSAENSTIIATLSASDPDNGAPGASNDAVTFALLSSRHSHLFRLDSLSGVLSWVSPPDFERPPAGRLAANTATNPQYLARVMVLSGNPPQHQTADLLVMITDVAEAPASPMILVNQYLPPGMRQVTSEASLAALSGVDAQSVPGAEAYTFRIDGGTDQSAFILQGGYLMLRSPLPEPGTPNDANTDGRYEVNVRIAGISGSGVAEEAVIKVHVYLSPIVLENTDLVMNVPAATQITGGADEALFRIRDNTLRFLRPPDYEAPSDLAGTAPDGSDQDAAGNNRYLVELTTGTNVRLLLIFVANSDVEVEAGSTVSALPGEIVTLTATSQTQQPTYNWRFVGSSMATREQIPLQNTDQAKMQFIVPSDAANEILTFEVDTGRGASQLRDTVTVNVQSALTLQDSSLDFPEDRAVGSLVGEPLVISAQPEQGVALWTIKDGDPQSLFEINPTTGQVRLIESLNSDQRVPPPTYALKLKLEFRVSTAVDLVNLSAEGVLRVNVTNINEAPSANAGGDQRVASGAVVQLIGIGSDMETPNSQLTYSWSLSDPNLNLTGGGTLNPIFAAPSTDTEDVMIIVTLTVTDDDAISPRSATDSSIITVSSSTAPSLMPSMVELTEDTMVGTEVHAALDGSNFPTGTSVWSFASGNIDNTFAINPFSGSVTLLNELDFEGANTSFELVVRRTIDAASAVATLTVTVTDADDAPVASIFGPGMRVVTAGALVSLRAEFTEQDPEMIGDDPEMQMPNPNAMEITHLWTLSDGSVAIADPDQLEVSFNAPASATTLTASFTLSQGGSEVIQLTQLITVVIGDTGPQVTTTEFTLLEGLLPVGQLMPVTDADGDPVTFRLASGDDETLFRLTQGGQLSFLSEPDFETPASGDSPPTNIYMVNIQAVSERDGANPRNVTQAITVTITDNTDEAPQFSETGTQLYSVAEGVREVATLAALEPESQTLTYSLLGADRGLFRVESGGLVMFKQPPDFEHPLDIDSDNPENLAGNNEYVVTLVATSIANPTSPMPLSDVVTMIISVTDVADETLPPPVYPEGENAYVIRGTTSNYIASRMAIGPPLVAPAGFSNLGITWILDFIGMYDANDINQPQVLIDRTNEPLFDFIVPQSVATPNAVANQLVTGASLSSDYERFRVRLKARNFYQDEVTQELEILINPDLTPGSVMLAASTLMVGTEAKATLSDGGLGTDDLATAAATWHWQYLDDSRKRWLDITGANNNSFTPGTFFQLRKLRAVASYLEDGIHRQVASEEQLFQPIVERSGTLQRLLGVLAREITADAVAVIASRFISRGREYALFGDIGVSGPAEVWGLAGAHVLRDLGEQQVNRDWFWQNLRGSSFAKHVRRANNAAGDGAGSPLLTIWGEGGYQVFKSDPTEETLRLSGNLTTAYIGIDWQFDTQGMAGIAYSHSRGRTDFNSTSDGNGSLNTRLNIIYPYIHYLFNDTVLLWGAFGYGEGNGDYRLLARNEVGRTSLKYQMFSGGFRESISPGSNVGFAWKGDFSSAKLTGAASGDTFPDTTGRATRVRMAAEGNFNSFISDAMLFSGTIDLGARYDGGSADSGFGIDINFDATFRNTQSGFTLTGRGNTLLDHQSKGMKSYGGAIAISIETVDGSGGNYAWVPFIEVAMTDQPGSTAMTAGIKLNQRHNWSLQFLTQNSARGYAAGRGGTTAGIDASGSARGYAVGRGEGTLFMVQFTRRL